VKNIASIEGLRGWLAWWVVLGHAMQLTGVPAWMPAGLAGLLSQGGQAVNVFIVVSGFVITHLLLSRQEPYAPYIIRRFMRIAPVYFGCLALAWLNADAMRLTFVDLPYAQFRDFDAVRYQSLSDAPSLHLLAHATLLHGLLPDNAWPLFLSTTILGPAWSLSLEWQFYLLAPLLVGRVRTRSARLVAVVAMAGAGLLARRWLPGYELPSLLLVSLHWFALGIGTRLAMEYMTPARWSAPAVLLALLAVSLLLRSKEALIWSLWVVFALHEAGLVRPSTAWQRLARALATNRLVRLAGRCSYATYLVHMPLMAIVVALWHTHLGIASRADMQAAVLTALLLVALLSPLMYRWIEKPGIRWGAALARRRAGGTAAAAA
jgi:peptidoglycan/LPS O-acetylase OafA/YrhL